MSALRVEFTKYFNKPKICTRYFLHSSPHPPSSLCSLSCVSLSWRRLYLLALWVDSSKAYKILLCPATSFQFPAGQAHSGKHTHCRTPTHTHIHSPAYIFIACLQGNLKNATHQNLASLSFSLTLPHLSLSLSLSPSLPLTLVCCHRSTAAAMAFLCKTTVCCQQHNGTRNTLSQSRQQGRQKGRQAGPNFPGSSLQLKQGGVGEWGR